MDLDREYLSNFIRSLCYYLCMKAKIYNEEGRLVANNEDTILELLEECGYSIDSDEKEMKKLRIKNGVSDE